jgi:poly(3-hydroxybutyrate) depolymerase
MRGLMIAMTGCTMQNSAIVNGGYNWEASAEHFGMVVVAAQVDTSVAHASNYCWTFWSSSTGAASQSASGQDNGYLIALATSILNNSQYHIDPNQVYLSGLSSGGGETNVGVCMDPALWAGGGSDAGPVLGSIEGFGGSDITPAGVQSTCDSYAGQIGPTSALNTQVFSAIQGLCDPTVPPANSAQEVAGEMDVYGMSSSFFSTSNSWGEASGCQTFPPSNVANATGTITMSGGAGGEGFFWNDANGHTRSSLIYVKGAPHTWFSGTSGSCTNQYTDCSDVNFPAYLSTFLFGCNLRVVPTSNVGNGCMDANSLSGTPGMS